MKKGTNDCDPAQMFHDLMALTETMRYFSAVASTINLPPLKEFPALQAMISTAWQELHGDVEAVLSRLLIVENVPSGSPKVVQEKLATAVKTLVPTARVEVDGIFLGVDKTKPRIQVPLRMKQSGNVSRRKEREIFKFKRDGDESGIIFHLATRDKGRVNSTNPQDAGLVIVTSSSLGSDSKPLSTLLDRKSTRVSTKATGKNEWFGFEFIYHTIYPTRYLLRMPIASTGSSSSSTSSSSDKTEYQKKWRFEASNNGKKWTCLREHKKDFGAQSKSGSSWEILGLSPEKSFSRFRIIMTHPTNGNGKLILGGFEIYGRLKKIELGPVTPTPFYAIIEIASGDNEELEKVRDALDGHQISLYLYSPNQKCRKKTAQRNT